MFCYISYSKHSSIFFEESLFALHLYIIIIIIIYSSKRPPGHEFTLGTGSSWSLHELTVISGCKCIITRDTLTTYGDGSRRVIMSDETFWYTTICTGQRFNKESVLDMRTHFKPTETFQDTLFTTCHPKLSDSILFKQNKALPHLKNRSLRGNVLTGNECYTINIVYVIVDMLL